MRFLLVIIVAIVSCTDTDKFQQAEIDRLRERVLFLETKDEVNDIAKKLTLATGERHIVNPGFPFVRVIGNNGISADLTIDMAYRKLMNLGEPR